MDDAALLLAEGGAEHGLLLWAGHQTTGRGRLPERHWADAPGGSLLFTLLLDPKRIVAEEALSLRVGLALAESVEEIVGSNGIAEVKWPNDLLLDGRKAAGILVRRGSRWVQVGVGLNLRPPSVPGELLGKAISLEEALPSGEPSPTPAKLLEIFLSRLESELKSERFRRERLEARLAYRGERIVCRSSAFPEAVSGVVAGVDADGALRLEELRREPEAERRGGDRGEEAAQGDGEFFPSEIKPVNKREGPPLPRSRAFHDAEIQRP